MFISKVQKEVKLIADSFEIPDFKAFSVWFAKVAWHLEDDDGFDALTLVSVEGPNEKGMDLFWVDHSNQQVLIAQCKYSENGTSRPRVKDLESLLGSTDWLSSPEALETEGRPELVAAANEYVLAAQNDYLVELWFVYFGSRDENIDKRIRVYNANPENVQHRRRAVDCDIELLKNFNEEYMGEDRRLEETTIPIGDYFEVKGSFGEGVVTSIAGSDLINLHKEYGDRLFARNVRSWLGARKGSVNAGIIDTVEEQTERGNFWAYNNGITLVCERYKINDDVGTITLWGFSIVNGCQTTVALASSNLSNEGEDVFLLARVISPPEQLIDSVIRFTNTQNQIRRWDLVSQDRIQRRLQEDFSNLTQPVFYAIRRGEWQSFSREEKRHYEERIANDLLAQYLAAFKGMAVIAYKNKAFLFDRYYQQVFPVDLRVEEALFIWRAGEITQKLVRQEIKEENSRISQGNRDREKYVLMLKRGGRFYALGVFGVIAMQRNGPDFLRSITEERINSKNAEDRISNYATLSIRWYKQAVDDLIQLWGTDLSTLIREADFFDRVRDRILNTYEGYSVNDEWLDGALPRLR